MTKEVEIIELAREIGRKIQDDERFIEMQIAKQKSDSDEVLQNAINEFNLKKLSINNEASKENVDQEKLRELNEQLRAIYNSIVSNENMIAANEKKDQLDEFVRRVTAIILQSANGEDPNTTDYQESECSGSCSGCSGCH